MTKKLLPLISIFVVVALLVGFIIWDAVSDECLDDDVQYEITFWAKNDNNIVQQRVYQKAVEDFEKLYPNIKVNIVMYNDYGKIDNDVKLNIKTGDTPNICITYPDFIATYLKAGEIVAPLDSFIVDRDYGFGGGKLRFDGVKEADMVDKFMSEGVINGKQYALPFMRSTEALYVNETYAERILLELGYDGLPEIWTWDLVWEVSEAAMAKNADGTFKINGQRTLIPFIYKSTDNMMITMLEQKGYPYSSEDGKMLIFNNNTKELLYEIAGYAGDKVFSTFAISSYPGNFFNRGQCIFAVDSTAGATWMGPDAPLQDIHASEAVDFEVGVKIVPQYDVNDPKMISQGPSICIFNKEDEGEVLASWLFAQFLLTDSIQIDYSKTEGYVPVTESAQNSSAYKDYLSRAGEDNNTYYSVKVEASRLFLKNIENTFTADVFFGSSNLRSAAGELIEEACKRARRKQPVDDAFMNSTYAKMITLYNLDSFEGALDGETVEDLIDERDGLPPASIILIVVLSVGFAGVIGYVIFDKVKKRRK